MIRLSDVKERLRKKLIRNMVDQSKEFDDLHLERDKTWIPLMRKAGLTSEYEYLITEENTLSLIHGAEVMRSPLSGPITTQLIKEIKEKIIALMAKLSKHYPGLSTKQRGILEYILNSCLTRIQYNTVFINFYKNSSVESVLAHLKNIIDSTITESIAKKAKTFYTTLELSDIKTYISLILFIEKHLNLSQGYASPELFDIIHEYAAKECQLIRHDESIPANELLHKLRASSEFQAGRELPHLEEICTLSSNFLSEKYKKSMECYTVHIINSRASFGHRSTPAYNTFFENEKQKMAILSQEWQETVKKIDELKLNNRPECKKLLNSTDSTLKILELLFGIHDYFIQNKYVSYGNPRNIFYNLYDAMSSLQTQLNKLKQFLLRNKNTEPSGAGPDSKTEEEAVLSVTETAYASDIDTTEHKFQAEEDMSSTDTIPKYVKEAVLFSLSRYGQQKDDFKLLDLATEYKKTQEGLSSQHLRLLARVLYDDTTLIKIFHPTVLQQSIKLDDLLNLVIAMNGKVINQAGCRFRVALNNCLSDTDIVSTPALHKHHGGDLRNNIVTKLTIALFCDLFDRANVKKLYQKQLFELITTKAPLEENKSEGTKALTQSST